jgi:protoheme IX farnesyltransferase
MWQWAGPGSAPVPDVLQGALAEARTGVGTTGRLRPLAYASLTKPDVTFLVILTTVAGFYMASQGPLNWRLLLQTLVGTAMIAAGTSALNHYIERSLDAKMRRTINRPLPQGTLHPVEALIFGVLLALCGAGYLAWRVNLLSSAVAAATSVSYLCIYTPLKRHTTLATANGALPGALPPLIGWAAAQGALSRGAWILFAMMFFWQFPHFLAIAWIYREDYERAGFRMLTLGDSAGRLTGCHAVSYALALLPAGLLPAVVGMAGPIYFVGAALLGLVYVSAAAWFWLDACDMRARRLLRASFVYLPAILILMVLNPLTS